MTEPRKLRVFLCHASQDKPIVRGLYQRLLTENWIDPWLDEEKLSLGQYWTSAIEEAIDSADIVVIFLSQNSVYKEGFIQRELNYVWELSLEKPKNVIFLIPFRLDDCEIPRYLRSRQWGDYYGEEKEKAYDNLLRSLKRRFDEKMRIWVEGVEETQYPNVATIAKRETTEDQNEWIKHVRTLLTEESKNVSRNFIKDYESEKSVNELQSKEPPSFLPSTISIETVGGVSTPIIHKGESLPAKISTIFSTASDNQTQVEIHLVLGENKFAKDNTSLGKYIFDGLPPAPKATAQVEIHVYITSELHLSLTAIDKTTNQIKDFQNIDLSNITPPSMKDSSVSNDTEAQGGMLDSFNEFFNFLFSKNKNDFSNYGRDIQIPLALTFEEAVFGTEKEIDINRYDMCPNCRGTGLVGGDNCKKCHGSGQQLNTIHRRVAIPAGVDTNTQIRLRGEGNIGRNGAQNGSVFLLVSVNSHPIFTRDDINIKLRYPIPGKLAVQGGSLKIPLLEGKYTEILIPRGIPDKQVFRISGKGVPKLRLNGRGDLYVTVVKYEPNTISNSDKRLLKFINEYLE